MEETHQDVRYPYPTEIVPFVAATSAALSARASTIASRTGPRSSMLT